MTWWIRPGRAASARSGSRRPARRARSRGERGRRCSAPRSASTSRGRRGPRAPAADRSRRVRGTRIWLIRRCGAASGRSPPSRSRSSRPRPRRRTTCARRSPTRRRRAAVVRELVGSAPETSGSVIEKNERAPSLHERLQEALLLLLGAEQVQDLAVAGVRRLAVERAAPTCCARSPRSGARTR